jgi:hypothetical protein
VTKREIDLKRHNGKVVACTTDIAAYCNEARHSHFMTACEKAIKEAADPGFGEENFILGTYTGRNQQDNLCYFVTRQGLDAMSKHLRGMAGHKENIQRTYDACERKLETKLAVAIGAVVPAVFLHENSGRWTVASRELAALTAHDHGNIMSAVRLAVEELEERGASGEVFWSVYFCRRNGRHFPCCRITREVMAQIRLHNVPGCRTVRDVVAEYIRLLDEKEAERLEPAETEIFDAEPAPDSEIRPPDPEPDNVFELVPKQRVDAAGQEDDPRYSWLTNAAVESMIKREMPESLRAEIVAWNGQRCLALFTMLVQRGTPATEAAQVFSTLPYGTLGRAECR